MALNRVKREKNDNYSTICNCIMREKTISLKAKGLYALVMSLPPTWDFSVQGIVAISKEESGAIYTAIKELIKEGYCKRSMVSEKGRFVGCEYTFFNKKRKPQEEEPHNEKPLRDFPHTENDEGNKLFNESNSSSINTPTDLYNNNKSVSNDTPKVTEFDEFYKLYPLKKSKAPAERSWNKLSEKDRQAAIQSLPAYIADCALNKRSFKHPSTFLNQRTWEDEFGVKPRIAFYDILDTDSEVKKRFKGWMRRVYPEIENTALPLSYEDYMELFNQYGHAEVSTMLDEIQKDIYMYRKADIAQVIKARLKEEDEL